MKNSPTVFKVAGLICAMTLFVGCNEEKAEELKSDIAALNSEVSAAKDERDELKAKEKELKLLILNHNRLQKKESETKAELEEIAGYHKNLEAALEYTSLLNEKWKAATRKSLLGEQLGLVRLTDKTLENAKVIGLDEENVILEHAGGQGYFKLAELPEELRKMLLHEPTLLLEIEITE